MDLTIPYVKVKQKYQITIPATLRNQLHIHEGDTLEANVKNGSIVFTPQSIVKRDISTKIHNKLSSYIGSARGVFSSSKDVDDFIRNERDLWD